MSVVGLTYLRNGKHMTNRYTCRAAERPGARHLPAARVGSGKNGVVRVDRAGVAPEVGHVATRAERAVAGAGADRLVDPDRRGGPRSEKAALTDDVGRRGRARPGTVDEEVRVPETVDREVPEGDACPAHRLHAVLVRVPGDVVALDVPTSDDEVVCRVGGVVLDLDPVLAPGVDLDPADAPGATSTEGHRISTGLHRDLHKIEVHGAVACPVARRDDGATVVRRGRWRRGR